MPDFDFTAEQWSEIMRAVQDGCAQPDRFNRDGLRVYADGYLTQTGSRRKPSHQLAALDQLERAIEKAVAALNDLGPIGFELFKDDSGRDAASLFQEIRERAWQHRRLEELVAPREITDQMGSTVFGSLTEVFYTGILDCWVEGGGEAKRSRNPNTNRPSGPTLRYLAAVSDAVRGSDAPGEERLVKIIGKYAKQLQNLRKANPGIDSAVRTVLSGGEPGVRLQMLRALALFKPLTTGDVKALANAGKADVDPERIDMLLRAIAMIVRDGPLALR